MITLAELLPARGPDFRITSGPEDDTEVYLERWYLHPRAKNRLNLYLHHMRRGDIDRHLHDHPWENFSLILQGGYWEETFLIQGESMGTKMEWRKPGDIIYRPATLAHKLHLGVEDRDCWSLFSTGPVSREWGFHTEDGWVPFRAYLPRYRPDQYEQYQHQKYEEDL